MRVVTSLMRSFRVRLASRTGVAAKLATALGVMVLLMGIPSAALADTFSVTPGGDGSSQNLTYYGDTSGEQFSVAIDPAPFATAGSDSDTAV